MSTKNTPAAKDVKVPSHFKGKTVWTVPSKDLKQEVPGRFEIDKCTPEELEYLSKKGTFDK